jgi:hypothetical protein
MPSEVSQGAARLGVTGIELDPATAKTVFVRSPLFVTRRGGEAYLSPLRSALCNRETGAVGSRVDEVRDALRELLGTVQVGPDGAGRPVASFVLQEPFLIEG